MTLKNMLMPVTPDKAVKTSLECAFHTAYLFSIHLSVVYIRPDPRDTIIYAGLEISPDDFKDNEFQQRMEKRGRKSAEKLRRVFGALCRNAGIKKKLAPSAQKEATASWRQIKGEAISVIPKLAKGADLAFFTPETIDQRMIGPNLLEATLIDSGRPILLSPIERSALDFSHIMIAWDASDACTRAISACLATDMPIRRATVLHFHELHENPPHMEEVLAHLAWHGIEATAVLRERSLDPIGASILNETVKRGCGLLVMGGYGNFRGWEAVFGGVTRYVIRKAKTPVFLMH